MTKFYLRLVFVLSCLTGLLYQDAQAQVEFNIRGIPGTSDYIVSMRSSVEYTGFAALTPSLQVTVRVPSSTNPADQFTVGNFTPLVVDQSTSTLVPWTVSFIRIPRLSNSPLVYSEFDYFFFSIPPTAPQLSYPANVEVNLFSFTNTGACLTDVSSGMDLSIIDNTNDPFLSPNPEGLNTANTISTFGSGGAEAFTGDYLDGSRDCSVNFPVEWLDFSATPAGSVVDIEWATAIEAGNKFFSVERSVDGRLFQEVMRVPGQGNTNEVTTYKEVDTDPIPGFSYYRLRQVDFDAGFSYSEIVEVFFDPNTVQLGIQVYPNPTSQSEGFNVVFDSPEEQYFSLELYTSNGQVIYKKLVEARRGNNQLEISTAGFASGVYHLRLFNDQQTESTQIIIK